MNWGGWRRGALRSHFPVVLAVVLFWTGQAAALDRLIITETDGSTSVSEAGPTSDSFEVVLETGPSSNVTVRIYPESDQIDIGEGPGVMKTLTFTTGNYNVAQTVTVTAVDDDVAEGEHSVLINLIATSGDNGYNGYSAVVTAHITDDDTAGVTITESAGSTGVNEQGPTSDTYTVVLTSEPTADVTVTIDPDGEVNLGSGAGVAVTRTFTTANWGTAQTVTVTAVNDPWVEGEHTSTIRHSASSMDPVYSGIAIRDVIATVTDNDEAGVAITESDGSTEVSEAGPTSDSYEVVLTAPPVAEVTVTVTAADGQTTVNGGATAILTFTPLNWSVPQEVTVTAVDDAAVEGSHTGLIGHTVASTDPAYNGLGVRSVVATIADNDSGGTIQISESGSSTVVSETAPSSDTYTVVLTAAPIASVTVTVTADDQTRVNTGATTTLTFTMVNWSTPQTVTVTAVDDTVAEGQHSGTIRHSAASVDPVYHGAAIADVAVTIADNDTAGVTIAESDGSTAVSENGPTSDTYTIVLTTPPVASVVVSVIPDGQVNLGGGAGVAVSRTFTTGNWSTPQTVTVTAVDDAAAEGSHTSIIQHTVSSIDGFYNGMGVRDVLVTISDNDATGEVVITDGGSTAVSEAGPTSDTYTVVLASAPSDDVTVTVTPDGQVDLGGGAGVAINLTFTTGDWDEPQTVTVTAVDDAAAEGEHVSTIRHSSASADVRFDGLSIADVAVTIADNDTAGVAIAESDGSTDVDEEGPTSDTYTVVLDSKPTANVTVTVDPDGQVNLGSGAGVARVLTFTTANWSTPQTVTVTAVDDAAAEGSHTSIIQHTVSSIDGFYNGMGVRDVLVTISDNDATGEVVITDGGSTAVSEAGPTSDTYTVVLASAPSDDVTVTVTPDGQVDLGGGAGVAINLTFTTGDWDEPQTVTVTAVDDAAAEGEHVSTIRHSSASADVRFDGLSIADVAVTIADNDTAGVAIAESDGSTDVDEEGPTSDTYTVVLDSKPTANVTVTVDPDGQVNLGSGAGVARVLTFTTANWSTPQTVTVTAVDDAAAEGEDVSVIRHSAASTDPVYSGIAIPDVAVTVTDNDTAAVIIAESGLSTAVAEEGPTSDTYTLVLSSPPTAGVTVTVIPDGQVNLGSGAGVAITVPFTTGNWNAPQTVTVTAVDDAAAEGEHVSRIQHTVSSADPAYDLGGVRDVVVTVSDNDTAGVTISETDGSTSVSETGPSSDTYTIVLTRPPTDDVVVSVIPDGQVNLGSGAGVAVSRTFTTGNWNAPQTVTVTAVNDAIAEGSHAARIQHTVASTDPAYNLAGVRDVTAAVADNDTAGVTINESGGTTAVSEQGATTDSYTVVLKTPPSSDVTVTVMPDAQTSVGGGAGVAINLTFATGDWNLPQTVTVTAVDDAAAEGAHHSQITHHLASSDTAYNGLYVRSVWASVTDNDAAEVSISESSGVTNVNEADAVPDTYTVVLTVPPTDDVTVTVDPDGQVNLGSGAGVPITLTFTTGNWSVARTVSVVAVDDAAAEGSHQATIRHFAASTDPAYNGAAIRNVTVNVTDDDTAAVSVTETDGTSSVAEQGPTSDDYSVVLTIAPSADVEVTATPDDQTDLGSGAGVPVTLTFTTGDWMTPQTVTVTAVDDAAAEGRHTSTIVHAAASTDLNYNGSAVRNVTVTIADNDAAAVTIAELDGSTEVSEQGPTSDSYTVVLDTAPSATVTVTVSPDNQTNLGSGAGVPVDLAFTTDDWMTPQTVTVTAVDDAVAEGAHRSAISHSAASADSHYNSIAIRSVTAHITDNDTGGVTIAESDGSTEVSEVGPSSDSYTLVLRTAPTADVVITATPDGQTDLGSGAGVPVAFTFTPVTWNAPQIVTVTAVNDLQAEGAHVSVISHTAASTDGNYNAIAILDVRVAVADNDMAGVIIAESDGSTDVDEDGPTSDTYTIVLRTPPTDDVQVTVDPDGQTNVGSGAGVARIVTFTSGNWSTPQTVTVTAVDDTAAEGPHHSIITHAIASIDPSYNAIVVANVTVNVTDDDSAAVVIAETDGGTVVSEAGPGSDDYTVVLSIAPTANVTISVDPDEQTDVGAGPGLAINLTFTAADWDVPQTVTVTAVDDTAAEGAHTSTITHTATSSDTNYNGISIRNVTAAMIDDDTAGVTITQSDGETAVDETGPTSDSYTIVLNIPPTANVVVRVDPDNQADVGAGPGVPVDLTFTPANWDAPQTVTVSAVDDQVAEGAQHNSTIRHTAASADPNYNLITIQDVTVFVTDNDTSGVAITESGGSTAVGEQGPSSDSYQIHLETPPTATVLITVQPDGQTTVGAGAGAAVTLTFTTGDWNTPQTVTVTAVDDQVAEARHTSTIIHTAASSDSNYNAITIQSVQAVITDNDVAAVSVAQSGGSTAVTETGPGSDTYTVVLTAAPTSDVVVTATPDEQVDLGGGAGESVDLTFTTANWNVARTVTVTAVDDSYPEGLHQTAIAHHAAALDNAYNGIAIASVMVRITDNDVAGATIAETGGSTATAEGSQEGDTYTVVLNTPVVNDVVLIADPDDQTDLGEGAGVAVERTFTAANWNVPRTITVLAVDDRRAEGPHASIIRHRLSSADLAYNGLHPEDVTVSLTDNDAAAVAIVESGGTTNVNEQDTGTDTYTVALGSRPIADVTVTAAADGQVNLGNGPGVAVALTFTAENWSTPQTVTVTAVDDDYAEGIHASTIVHRAESEDAVYNGIVIRSVTVNLTDNDAAAVTITESGGSTHVAEHGATSDSYTLVLATPPTAEVVVTAICDGQVDLGAGAGTPVALTFRLDNWDEPQTVTVTCVDDLCAESVHCSTIVHAASSRDPAYNGITVRQVVAAVTDDDVAGVTVTETDGSTAVAEEGATSDGYSVVLNTVPHSNVTLTVEPDGQTDVGAEPGAALVLTFTPNDWDQPQTVTVTAVDDAYAEGLHAGRIAHRVSSQDVAYNEITVRTLTVEIADNDGQGIAIIETEGGTRVSEEGPTADTYQVVLTTPITGDVEIAVKPDFELDVGGGAGVAMSLFFTPADWNVPQTVTVTAADDWLNEGDHSGTIWHIAHSRDGSYNRQVVGTLTVAIEDNDQESPWACGDPGLLVIAALGMFGLLLTDPRQRMVSPGRRAAGAEERSCGASAGPRAGR